MSLYTTKVSLPCKSSDPKPLPLTAVHVHLAAMLETEAKLMPFAFPLFQNMTHKCNICSAADQAMFPRKPCEMPNSMSRAVLHF